MELAPQGKFNYNNDPLATPSSELALVNKKLPVFQKLVTLPDFTLDQCNFDRALGTSMSFVECITSRANDLSPPYIKALCANLAQVNQLVKIKSFPTIKGMNLLMLAAYYGKTKLCEELIKNGADVTIITEQVTGQKLSAISFAGPNMSLIEKLIEAGCLYTCAFVDVTGKMLANGALNIVDFMTNLYDLLEKRDFYQKAADLVNRTSNEEQKVILSKITDAIAEKAATQKAGASDSVERADDNTE